MGYLKFSVVLFKRVLLGLQDYLIKILAHLIETALNQLQKQVGHRSTVDKSSALKKINYKNSPTKTTNEQSSAGMITKSVFFFSNSAN